MMPPMSYFLAVIDEYEESLQPSLNPLAGQFTEIPVHNLVVDCLNEMVSNILLTEPKQTFELFKMMHRKTLGNPYFALQMLETLQTQSCVGTSPSAAIIFGIMAAGVYEL
jgi:predicted ATPase